VLDQYVGSAKTGDFKLGIPNLFLFCCMVHRGWSFSEDRASIPQRNAEKVAKLTYLHEKSFRAVVSNSLRQQSSGA
jgi:hypothetical protein